MIAETGSLAIDRHTMRVVSANTDLTGQLELAWVTDPGTPVGDAHCTQTIQLSPSTPPKVRPTLLLCWRTSAARSVYTLAVDLDQAPSAPDSVALLDRTWARMGG